MACVIQGRDSSFVVYSYPSAQWIWVKDRQSAERLSPDRVHKLVYDKGILYFLLPGGWIEPHPCTVEKVGWSNAASYLRSCFKNLVGQWEVWSQRRNYVTGYSEEGVPLSSVIDCREVEWKARLCPFLVEYHPINYNHPDKYPGLGLMFYFQWEPNERGLFATTCDVNTDFEYFYAHRANGCTGNPEDLLNYSGYWDRLADLKRRENIEIVYPWSTKKKPPRKPRGGARRVDVSEELSHGNLTRKERECALPGR